MLLAEKLGGSDAELPGRVADFGHQGPRHAEETSKSGSQAPSEVEEEGTGRIGRIRYVDRASVSRHSRKCRRAKGQFAGFGTPTGTGEIVQIQRIFVAEKYDSAEGPSLVDHFFDHVRSQARTEVRGAAILPDDGVGDRFAGPRSQTSVVSR